MFPVLALILAFVVLYLSWQNRKLRRENARLQAKFWDGEASTGTTHVIDAPVIMRLHLNQDR